MDRQTAINTFLQRYAEDWASGNPLTVEDYSKLFPGHEATVEKQYALLVGEAEVSAQSDTGATTDSWGKRTRTIPNSDPDAPSDAHTGAGMRFGPYKLLTELGRGGQGEVWLAEDERIGRKVALKTLTMVGRLSSKGFERLQLEARVASRLDHPGICTVYEADQIDGVPFVAMQRIDGQSLSSLIRRAKEEPGLRDPLPLPATSKEDIRNLVECFESMALALEHAHENGVLHRDIKPGNVLIDGRRQPVLLDFGLAHDLQGDDDSVSEGISGTPAYLAPERLAVAAPPTDVRVDVYGLGVSLYEVLTMRRPFEGATREHLFRAILGQEATDPRRINPHISRDLAVVVATAMAKEPDRRYDSAAAFAADLAAVRERRPIVARRPSIPQRVRLWAGRHPRSALLSVLLIVASVATAGLGGYLAARLPDMRAGRVATANESRRDLIEVGFGELGELHRDGARAAFERALVIAPDDILARVGLALAYLSESAPEDALAALDAHPGPAPTELEWVRAEVSIWLGETDCLVSIEAGLPPPLTGQEHFVLGTLELFRGHQGRRSSFAPAAEHLSQALLQPVPAYAFHYVSLADALTHCPLDDRSSELAEAMTHGWPDSYGVQLLAGLTLQREDTDAALAANERALKANPQGVRAAVNIVSLLITRDGADAGAQALDRAREACQTDADFATVARLEGQLSKRIGQLDAALDHYRRAVRLDPRRENYIADLLTLVQELEGAQAAADEARKILEWNPDAKRPRVVIANHAYNRGVVAEALPLFQEILDRAPWSGSAHHSLGLIHAAKGTVAEAMRHFTIALKCQPSPTTELSLLSARLDAGQLNGLADAAYELAGRGTSRAERLAIVAEETVICLEEGIPEYSATKPATPAQLEAAARAFELSDRMAEAQVAWIRFSKANKAPATSAGSAWWRSGRAGILAAGDDASSAEEPLRILLGVLNGTERGWRDGRAGDRLFGELVWRYHVDPALDPWRDQPQGTPWAELFTRVEALLEELAAGPDGQ